MKTSFLIFCFFLAPANAATDKQTSPVPADQSNVDVMRGFTQDQDKLSDIVAVSEKRKHQVMFFMGVPLLLLLFITGALGIAMGVYGKPVFVAHMVCAGLSLTLALAHAVAGVVWFYPF